MISRRDFFGLLGGALAHQAASSRIYVLPPLGGWRGNLITPGEALFFLPEEKWTYRYVYRNNITGHVSNAAPNLARLAHNFFCPEADAVRIRRMMTDGF